MHDAVYLPMIGRVLLGLFFIFLAVSHGFNWKVRAQGLRERNVIMPTLVLWIGVIVYFLGGLCLVFSLALSTVVTVLVIAVIIRAIITGNFWSKKGDDMHCASIKFMTNIAIIGALLMAL